MVHTETQIAEASLKVSGEEVVLLPFFSDIKILLMIKLFINLVLLYSLYFQYSFAVACDYAFLMLARYFRNLNLSKREDLFMNLEIQLLAIAYLVYFNCCANILH